MVDITISGIVVATIFAPTVALILKVLYKKRKNRARGASSRESQITRISRTLYGDKKDAQQDGLSSEVRDLQRALGKLEDEDLRDIEERLDNIEENELQSIRNRIRNLEE